MITFKYIFGGIIIATIYFFIIRNILEKNDIYKISRKNTDRVLGLTQLHIMFIFMAIGLTKSLNPFSESNFINSILNDTFLGSIYDFFYDERPAPDAYVVAIVDKIKQNQNTFVFVGLLFSCYDFVQELLSCGSELEVISPQSLRKEIKQYTEEMCEIYNPKDNG